MEREILSMCINEPKIKSKDLNQQASFLCKKLFPEHFIPPTQGELQNIILLIKANGGGEREIIKTGLWWLWIRNLFIENTITQEEKRKIIKIGAASALDIDEVTIVTTRSPELLHSKINGQGDSNLPRSVIALEKLKTIMDKSKNFLPTKAVVVFADLAIDNFSNIQKVCDVESTITQNINLLRKIVDTLRINDTVITKMSDLSCSNLGKLSNIIRRDGTLTRVVEVPIRAARLISSASNESLNSHMSMFGWTKEQSFAHSRNLAISMGLVGKSLQEQFPNGILIHNESFISRGRLNNIFIDPKNPLPVICLRDLLENKKGKM